METKAIAKKGLNATQLQWIAILCMIIDHVAWRFVSTETPLGLGMHFLGRITFPIMAYFVAQGYHYSRNVPRYIGRLFALAAISIVPFFLMASPIMGIIQNTVFTLALGLTALYFGDKIKNIFLRNLVVFLLMVVSIFFDAGVSGVLMIYFMGRTKNKNTAIWGGIGLMYLVDYLLQFLMIFLSNALGSFTFGVQDVVFIAGSIASGALLMCYNGEKGKKAKYLFYIVYPLHLLAVWGATLIF